MDFTLLAIVQFIPPVIKLVLWTVGLVAGTQVMQEAIKSFFPAGEYKTREREMLQFQAMQKQSMGAQRLAQSEMVQYYRDLIPQQFKQMREQEERQQAFALESQGQEQDFTREMAAGEYEARRDELMLNKLVPQAPTEMSTPEIALRAGEQMGRFFQPDLAPAILPFDPNYPITALSRQQ